MNAIKRFFGLGDQIETRTGSVGSAGGDSPLAGVIPPPRTELGVTWREALKVSAFSRSMDQTNTMMSSMPATVRDARRRLILPDAREFPSIVSQPNLDMDYEEFVQSTVNDLFLHGEFIWLRVGDPQTVNLIPVAPHEMTIVRERLPDGTWGRVRYGHLGRAIPRSRVIHKKHTAITGEPRGIGPRQLAQAELRAALTLAEFQREWFDSSNVPSGTLNTDLHLSATEQDELQSRWNNFLRSHRGQSVVLAAGLSYDAIQLKPADAQMLEVQDAIDRRIVRICGTPAFDLLVPGGTESRTYQNLEQSTLQYLVATLAKYMNAFERGLTDVIPRGNKVELDETGLLRMDSKTRAEVDTANVQNRTRTPNELRARDGLEPLPDGDAPPAPKQVASERLDQPKEIDA
ncbi:phage portal protein [Rhodococcus sp. I2R]|uniref:phage portal protein n=1 Tax=Rhodococcus sp. I2R TaxID=2855445 RepID=UPI001E53F105|nr:phage portal protein [Rhodococcus sp. I2R]MCC8930823.1 phage portal protein [Rhodococcus sp. I2R]